MNPFNQSKLDAIKRIQSKKKQENNAQLIAKLLQGDIASLSKAITILESSRASDRAKAKEILNSCLPYSGKSKRIGITGVPGVGKSSFLEAFGMYLVNNYHLKIAVLAVDPSSKSSGGSILGDKTRMEQLSMHPNVYIRPSPTANSLGGVARKTRETLLLCEAAGFDIVFIETVGVGQSETTVKNMVDFFLLLMLAGAGDELQGIKRGIMEMSDTLVVTKADGANEKLATRAASAYKSALHLLPASPYGWVAKVLTCSAHKEKGLEKIWDVITSYFEEGTRTQFLNTLRQKQNETWFLQSVQHILEDDILQSATMKTHFDQLQLQIKNETILPHIAAEVLFEKYKGFLKEN